MDYTETKRTRYGTRLKNCAVGIGTGILLFFIGAGTVLLWWNEGRTVKTDRMLEECQEVTVHVGNVDKIDNKLNGKLIHATAMTTTSDSIVDATFGVGATCVKLNRMVQYYQWVEYSSTNNINKIGGAQNQVTEYTCVKKWVKKPVDSQSFHTASKRDCNFTLMNVTSEQQVAKNVNFGAYKLPENLISSMSGDEPVNLNIPIEQLERWNTDAINTASQAKGSSGIQYQQNASATTPQTAAVDLDYIHVNGNELYIGRSSSSPEVGDVKITFTKVLPCEASVIALVSGNSLQSFTARNGKSFSMLTMGAVSADRMYQNQHNNNVLWTWILRIIGMLLVVLGLKSVVRILMTLFKTVPFLAIIVGMTTGTVCWIFGIVWSLLIIAIARVFYRPAVGITLLAAAGGLIFWLVKRSKDKKSDTRVPNEPQIEAN